MAVFTCITTVLDSFHLTQHSAGGPETAFQDHIAALPYDDGAGPFDDELDLLLRISGGTETVELLPVGECRGTWMWLAGARYKPPYYTYIIRTDVGPDAESGAATDGGGM